MPFVSYCYLFLGSCIIHILNTGVLKFKRKFRRLKVKHILLRAATVFTHSDHPSCHSIVNYQNLIGRYGNLLKIVFHSCCHTLCHYQLLTREDASMQELYHCSKYSRTPLLRINWDGEPSGYAENSDNWIFV